VRIGDTFVSFSPIHQPFFAVWKFYTTAALNERKSCGERRLWYFQRRHNALPVHSSSVLFFNRQPKQRDGAGKVFRPSDEIRPFVSFLTGNLFLSMNEFHSYFIVQPGAALRRFHQSRASDLSSAVAGLQLRKNFKEAHSTCSLIILKAVPSINP